MYNTYYKGIKVHWVHLDDTQEGGVLAQVKEEVRRTYDEAVDTSEEQERSNTFRVDNNRESGEKVVF